MSALLCMFQLNGGWHGGSSRGRVVAASGALRDWRCAGPPRAGCRRVCLLSTAREAAFSRRAGFVAQRLRVALCTGRSLSKGVWIWGVACGCRMLEYCLIFCVVVRPLSCCGPCVLLCMGLNGAVRACLGNGVRRAWGHLAIACGLSPCLVIGVFISYSVATNSLAERALARQLPTRGSYRGGYMARVCYGRG